MVEYPNTRWVWEGSNPCTLFYWSIIEGNDCLRSARNVFAVATDTGVGSARRVRSTLSGAAVVRVTKACTMTVVATSVFIAERRRCETQGQDRAGGKSLKSEGEYGLYFIVGRSTPGRPRAGT